MGIFKLAFSRRKKKEKWVSVHMYVSVVVKLFVTTDLTYMLVQVNYVSFYANTETVSLDIC
jgi:hypothetical protein